MINHPGTPWGASRLGEEGVPKVGHAAKGPARFVFFTNPWFVGQFKHEWGIIDDWCRRGR